MKYVVRVLAVIAGLAAWFFTQGLIAVRPFPECGLGDRIFDATAHINRFLLDNPSVADGLLIASSLVIDVLGCFLLLSAIVGPTIRPFLGLLIVFSLRQICQAICALPPPEGMIWRSPGFPSLLVTYGTASDFFFSGHTAIAVFGSTELARRGGRGWLALGTAIAFFEVVTVLILRAHYTLDVFTGVIAALWAASVAASLAPSIDRFLSGAKGGEKSVAA